MIGPHSLFSHIAYIQYSNAPRALTQQRPQHCGRSAQATAEAATKAEAEAAALVALLATNIFMSANEIAGKVEMQRDV